MNALDFDAFICSALCHQYASSFNFQPSYTEELELVVLPCKDADLIGLYNCVSVYHTYRPFTSTVPLQLLLLFASCSPISCANAELGLEIYAQTLIPTPKRKQSPRCYLHSKMATDTANRWLCVQLSHMIGPRSDVVAALPGVHLSLSWEENLVFWGTWSPWYSEVFHHVERVQFNRITHNGVCFSTSACLHISGPYIPLTFSWSPIPSPHFVGLATSSHKAALPREVGRNIHHVLVMATLC